MQFKNLTKTLDKKYGNKLFIYVLFSIDVFERRAFHLLNLFVGLHIKSEVYLLFKESGEI